MIGKNNETVKLTYSSVFGKITDKAMRFKFADKASKEEHWIPTSCIQAFDPNSLQVTIETWILIKKDINFNV